MDDRKEAGHSIAGHEHNDDLEERDDDQDSMGAPEEEEDLEETREEAEFRVDNEVLQNFFNVMIAGFPRASGSSESEVDGLVEEIQDSITRYVISSKHGPHGDRHRMNKEQRPLAVI